MQQPPSRLPFGPAALVRPPLLPAKRVAAAALLAFAACNDPAPADDAGLSALERLGKHLFEDTRLSEPAGQSCASCHDAARGFASNDVVARGAHADRVGGRNVPTAMYASFSPPFAFVDGDDGPTPTGGLFWDGRANDLAAQAGGPLLNPLEMANASKAAVVAKVAGGEYRELVYAALGSLDADPDLAFDQITVAIAAYESSARFHPFASKFDAWLRGEETLTEREAHGYALFVDPEKGNCIACHAGTVGSHEPRDWLFTDFTFDTLGLPRNAAIPANADPQFFDRGLCTRDVCDAFKVPTLRNVALTFPYFHDGSKKTLLGAVDAMATYQLGAPLGEKDTEDVVAFLKTLTGEYQGKRL